jgi:MFS family permease
MEEKFYTKSFIGLVSTNFLYWIGVYLYIPVLPIYFHTAGMNSQEIGLIVGSFSLGSVLFRILGGKASDRYGSVPIVTLGIVITGVAIAGYWLTASLLLVLLLRFLHGIGSALYSSAAVTMVTLLHSAKQTKRGVAIYTLCSMIGIGFATSTASWLFQEWGFQGIVLISGIATWICLLLIPKKIKPREKQASSSVSIKMILLNPKVYLPTLNQFAVYVCYASVMTYLPLMVYETDAAADMGWFYISYTISVVSSRFLAGKTVNRLDQKEVSTFLLAILAVVILLPIFSQEWYFLLMIGIGTGLGVGLATPTLIGMITDHVDAANRGVALGFFATAIDLGMGAGSILLGVLAEPFGYRSIFIAASLWTLFTCIVYFRGINAKTITIGLKEKV